MGAKVLIAHGDTQRLEKAVRELSAVGYDVVATPDGGDAFARFFEESPELVICSESLPVLDGLSFGRMIRSQAPDVQVVLLVEGEARASDEFLLLPEPLDLAALQQLVPELAPGAGARRRAPTTPPEPEPELVGEAGEVLAILTRFQGRGNLLALLDAGGVQRMARIGAVQAHAEDERVIGEGDPCDGFYLVVDGEVRVTLAERGDQEVARLGAGEFFGEMALLSNQPRSASVWTCGATSLLFFERDAVLALLEDYPDLREVLGGVAVQRAEENLWQALAEDGDVQRNLSELLEGLEDGAARPEQAPAAEPSGPESADGGAGDVAEGLGGGVVEGGAQGDLEAALVALGAGLETQPAGEVVRAHARTRRERLLAAGRDLLAGLRPLLESVRVYGRRHPFESGLALGTIAGMALMGLVTLAVMDIARDSEAELPEAPVVPEPTASPQAPAGAGLEAVAIPTGESVGDDHAEVAAPAAAAEQEAAPAAAAGDAAVGSAAEQVAAGAMPGDESKAAEQPEPAGTPMMLRPEPAAAQAATAPTPAGDGITDRKELRRQLFAAFHEKQFVQAVSWGTRMREAHQLDWESLMTLAHAEREAGDAERAVDDYLVFIKDYPTNVHADDARFWAAELLAGAGRKGDARALYRAVAADEKSDFRERAAERLAAMK